MNISTFIRSKIFIRILSIIAIFISLTVAIGWILDDTDFLFLFATKYPLKFDTAICFILLSGGIIINQSELTTSIKNFYSSLLGTLSLIIGSITVIEFLFNTELLDVMFISSNYFSSPHDSMSLNTAASIVLLSVSVIFINTRFKAVAYLLSFFTLIISMLVFIGYKIDEPIFINLGENINASKTAIILILLLTFVIYLTQPYKSIMSVVMSETVGGYLARRWIPIALIIPGVIAYFKNEILSLFKFSNVNLGLSFISVILSLILLFLAIYSSNKLYHTDLKRKEAEDKILKLNTELEEKVNKRTNELHLINKELEAFTYSVSHDLRAPLRSIEGFSKILFDEYKDVMKEESLEYLSRVRNSSQKMNKLIEDLLKLSRITQKEIRKKEFSLTNLIRTTYDESFPKTNGHDILFNIEGNMIVKADEDLLRIAITNLLDNALKFAKCRNKIIIEIGSMIKDGRKIYFIKDNGVGFDMNYKDKLFNAFQRLHTSKDFEGLGIGLAITKRIFLKHGGDIYAEAEVDSGATFYFYL